MKTMERKGKTLTLVRALGFDTAFYLGENRETVFFLGPHLISGCEEGEHATEAAILEFVEYWQNQIEVAKDYLSNNRNNKTHEWRVRANCTCGPSSICASCAAAGVFDSSGKSITVEEVPISKPSTEDLPIEGKDN